MNTTTDTTATLDRLRLNLAHALNWCALYGFVPYSITGNVHGGYSVQCRSLDRAGLDSIADGLGWPQGVLREVESGSYYRRGETGPHGSEGLVVILDLRP